MTATYVVLSQVQRQRWDNALQQTVDGWEVTVRWLPTDTIFSVFVAAGTYSTTNVDAAVRDRGAAVSAVNALGATAAPPSPPAAA